MIYINTMQIMKKKRKQNIRSKMQKLCKENSKAFGIWLLDGEARECVGKMCRD